MTQIRRLSTADAGFSQSLAALLAWDAAADDQVQQRVAAIIAEVRGRGDAALLELTARFDHWTPTSAADLEIPRDRIAQAWAVIPSEQRQALEAAAGRIRAYAQRQRLESWDFIEADGTLLGQQISPLDRAGLYVPGGKAAYPSSVLMNAIPAKVAGVGELIMVVPTPGGEWNDLVLAAAHCAGVDRAFAIGGAQAIAALAFGTESIPRVDVISGPGNLWVTLAKKAVYGRVGIDSLAGPSEVLVIADHSARADQVAADLMAQAELDPLAAAILITTDAALAAAVPAAIAAQLEHHPRAAITRQALEDWGLIVVCDDLTTAAGLSDRFAPEHLELLVEDPEPLAERIRHAGAIFLGPWSPEAVGDYLAGPNHTLPTSGTARFAGALSVETFLRHTSLIHFNQAALEATGPAVVELAESEGLHSHAESVRRRLG